MMESLIVFKRAGADGVLTHFALRATEKLRLRRESACSYSKVRRLSAWITAGRGGLPHFA
jgi:hypothetical protein